MAKKENPYSIYKDSGKYMLEINDDMTLQKGHIYEPLFNFDKQFKKCNLLILDFTNCKSYDSYLVIFIRAFKVFSAEKNIKLEITNVGSEGQQILEALLPNKLEDDPAEERPGFLYRWVSKIGRETVSGFKNTLNFTEFIGNIFIGFIKIFIKPAHVRWKDLPYHFTRSGVNALPIIVLIVFLIGVITGYQGAIQLKQFGADIYIADLIGISITRELAPLMTAILVAGRSGSAFAAEIGTMKVSEEVDALNSMGFDHFSFLVLPRVIAVMLSMPFLVIIADLAGIAGGLLTAITALDITVAGYVNQLSLALNYGHVFTGIFKSVIFGFLVASIGCYSGMKVRGGAESVGRYTTASVVTGVLLIILSDALFTFLFQVLGI